MYHLWKCEFVSPKPVQAKAERVFCFLDSAMPLKIVIAIAVCLVIIGIAALRDISGQD